MMKKIIVIFSIVSLAIQVNGHGYLLEPPNRSSLWREDDVNNPINYDDNALYCGGANVQYQENEGRCGPCGDNWADPAPRANENGGYYGRGVIARTYYEGTNFQAQVNVTASHGGHFEFSLCDLSKTSPETEDCFTHPLNLVDGSPWYNITKDLDYTHGHVIYLQLPQGFTCERCSMRWHWRTGNSYGVCDDGSIQLGCGNQETFRNCADIKIIEKQ